MHIPENYLSPLTCGVMAGAMVPVWAHAIKRVKTDIPKEKMPLLGVGAAFSFVGMMFNIPIFGGSTGHAVGGTLIAILLGPDAACISVTIALLLQALLFGDGGILAFGANCFNMAFVLPYLGYFIYRLICKALPGDKGEYLGAVIGSYIGINAAALCAAIEFGIQPLLFKDAAGQALYCPYDLSISIPAMMAEHLTLFGLVEAVFTVCIFAFVKKTSPGLIHQGQPSNSKPMYALLGGLMLFVPLGLLAEGTAWGEWGADEMAELTVGGSALGYTPQGMLDGFTWNSLLPDYSLAGLSDTAGYYLSAIVAVAILIIVFKLISASMKPEVKF